MSRKRLILLALVVAAQAVDNDEIRLLRLRVTNNRRWTA